MFFATHGASLRWSDGSYASVLDPWTRSAAVVLLHLLPVGRWKGTTLSRARHLSRPDAGCGNVAAARFSSWWTMGVDSEDARPVRVPAVPLEPVAMLEWALMQMARGRRAPMFPLPHASSVQEPRSTDYARMAAALRDASPDAYRLAVYLAASSAFTIPVARLMQEARFECERRSSGCSAKCC